MSENVPKAIRVAVAVVTTAATAVLPVLVDQHVISASTAAFIGSIVAALAAGHHGTAIGNAIAARKTPPTQPA